MNKSLKDAIEKAVELDVRELNATPSDDPSRAKLSREVAKSGKILLDVENQEANQKINERRLILDEKSRSSQQNLEEKKFKEECSRAKNNQKLNEEEISLKKSNLKLEETKFKRDAKHRDEELKFRKDSDKSNLKLREKELSLKERELKLKEDEQNFNDKKLDIEMNKLNLQQRSVDLEIEKTKNEFALKREELVDRRTNDKSEREFKKIDLILKIAGIAVSGLSIFISAGITIGCAVAQHRLIKANMYFERVEHGFVPKSINDMVKGFDKLKKL